MLAGFLLAIISEKYVFANANLKSETFVGCFVLVAALLLMLFRQERAATVIADVFCGYGIGILGSAFCCSLSNWPIIVSVVLPKALSSFLGRQGWHLAWHSDGVWQAVRH